MLTHLHIQNFIIIEEQKLDFKKGLSVITGETGAGKSIVIDALSLVLGGRGDSNYVGPFADKLDLTACFNLENISEATDWLQQNELGEAPFNECIIRRILYRDGKSRQMINGYNCTLQQLKELVPMLMTIHSQNQQQLLTKRSHQRELLDSYANNTNICERVKKCFQLWFENEKQIVRFEKLSQNAEVQCSLLEYQVEEFEKLALIPNEYEQLDQEHKQLANADELMNACQNTLLLLSEREKNSAQDFLYQAQSHLQIVEQFDERLRTANELLNNSIIHLEEAVGEVRSYLHQVDINPERLQFVESRLSKIHELARKYQTSPIMLIEVKSRLVQELTELKDAEQQHKKLKAKAELLKNDYFSAAKDLHQSRQTSAKELNNCISEDMQRLGMPGGIFKVVVTFTQEITINGSDEIEFLVATNPGQPLQPLTKVASGGEISRIALAIYVTTALQKTTPAIVFDEVDVGIGGSTAAIVGQLLKHLSTNVQVLCITHLPQVAAFGTEHFCVQKNVEKERTTTCIRSLNQEQRIEEVARMLGGIKITERTLAHAKELITQD